MHCEHAAAPVRVKSWRGHDGAPSLCSALKRKGGKVPVPAAAVVVVFLQSLSLPPRTAGNGSDLRTTCGGATSAPIDRIISIPVATHGGATNAAPPAVASASPWVGRIGPQRGKKSLREERQKHHHMASVGGNLKARLTEQPMRVPRHKQSNLQSREPVAAASNRRRHHLETTASFPSFSGVAFSPSRG